MENEEIKKGTMGYVRVLWNSRQIYERLRDCVMSLLHNYVKYHCLVIRNLFIIILDTVPTNLACSTLSIMPKEHCQKKNANMLSVMFLYPF